MRVKRLWARMIAWFVALGIAVATAGAKETPTRITLREPAPASRARTDIAAELERHALALLCSEFSPAILVQCRYRKTGSFRDLGRWGETPPRLPHASLCGSWCTIT
ncbi:MAG: hypothetical protein GXP31_14570 [Kiritimatiellaeota bacterium]|nr:hypothetical protein [Kiritimatiellota bacterium]